MKKIDYASMFTLRKDGRYQGYWRELNAAGERIGPRHAIYDRDPEMLFNKIQEREGPKEATFADMAEGWEAKHRQEIADRTWSNYCPHLADITKKVGARPIDSITAMDVINDLAKAKARDYSKTVVNTRKVIWDGVLNHAVAEGKIPYNPALGVKLPKGLKAGKRKAPDDDIIRGILDGANDMQFGFIPFFLLCTGVRRNEALHRLKSDVDTKSWELNIPKSKTEAGIRTVPIIQPLREPLLAWMAAHPGPYLFPHVDHKAGRKGNSGHMSETNWETAWANYCAGHGWLDEGGRPTITAHNLRHGTATLLFENGVDVYTAQHILGHANIQTTMAIYTELRQKQKQKGIDKFGRALSKKLSNRKK